MNAEAIEAILAKLAGTLSGEQQAVVDLIRGASSAGESITQHEIAKSEPWIGCHPRHEAHLAPEHETTLRRVRAIIRDLRLAHGVPIISSRDGYRFPGGKDEAQAYLKRMEREAKARAWSSLETYRGMSKLLGLKSDYFEGVEKLHAQMELFGKPPRKMALKSAEPVPTPPPDCPKCNGVGRLPVGNTNAKEPLCDACGGSGFMMPKTPIGELVISRAKETCGSCGGSGSIRGEADCPNCDGAGFIVENKGKLVKAGEKEFEK